MPLGRQWNIVAILGKKFGDRASTDRLPVRPFAAPFHLRP